MAAPMLVARLHLGVNHRFVSCLWRSFQNSAELCAGQDWRIRHGLARSDSEYGPLTDLPDWSYSDGRQAPLYKGQLRRKEENKALASRIMLLNNEIDQGMKNWSERQEKCREEQLLRQKHQLKSKALFKKTAKPK
ncbi:large ribosomal subunit protein mL52 isoform X2 [Pseudophryne corroboree]|uniref:large ribosomal subunit protein mL52 isoform X2 n=1 Tax=Pseudophryne corroboree TaxID=495146 RepID=UPI003081EDCE